MEHPLFPLTPNGTNTHPAGARWRGCSSRCPSDSGGPGGLPPSNTQGRPGEGGGGNQPVSHPEREGVRTPLTVSLKHSVFKSQQKGDSEVATVGLSLPPGFPAFSLSFSRAITYAGPHGPLGAPQPHRAPPPGLGGDWCWGRGAPGSHSPPPTPYSGKFCRPARWLLILF